jgi:TonB family protein
LIPSFRKTAFALAWLIAWSAATAVVRAQLVPPRPSEGDGGRAPYPADGDGQPARVLLELTLDIDGNVEGAQVLRVDRDPPQDRPFGEAAMEFVKTLRFEPATQDGEPIRAIVRYEVSFVPETPSVGPEAPPSASPEQAAPPLEAGTEAEPEAQITSGSAEEAIAPTALADFGATAQIEAAPVAPPPAAASDIDIEIGALQDLPWRNASELLVLAPGMVLQNHSGEGHAPTLFLRGFDAGEGQDVEFLIEGVPLNEPSNAHGHGYSDVSFIIPELVQSLQVLEGPFDPRQGDFAVAGTINYRMGTPRRGVTLSGRYGSFNDRRLLLTWAPHQASDATVFGIDLQAGDGFGPNRAFSNVRALGQYADTDGPLKWALLFAAGAVEFDSAGVIREDDFENRALPCPPDSDSQFFCLYDPNQGGSGSRYLTSFHLDHVKASTALGMQVFLSYRKHRIRENFTGFLLDPRGDGLDENTQTTTAGGRAYYRLERDWRAQPQVLEVGLYGRFDTGVTQMWRLRAEGGAPYETVFDTDYSITNVAGYFLGEFRPSSWFTLTGGLRMDGFAFQLIELDQPTSDRQGDRLPEQATDAFGYALQPRGSMQFKLVDELRLVTSVGMGSRSTDAQALSEGESAPFARVFANELGLTWLREGTWRADLRAFGFYTWVDDDLVFDPERGRNIPVGSSQRFGATAYGRVTGPWLDTLASFTWTEAFLGGDIFAFQTGSRLPFVPRFVASLNTAGRYAVPIRRDSLLLGAAIGVAYVGPKPLPLSTQSEPYFTLDTSIRMAWRFVEAAFWVRNVTDARNRVAEFHYPSNFVGPEATPSLQAERHFAAGPPRTYWGTLTFFIDTKAFTEGKKP